MSCSRSGATSRRFSKKLRELEQVDNADPAPAPATPGVSPLCSRSANPSMRKSRRPASNRNGAQQSGGLWTSNAEPGRIGGNSGSIGSACRRCPRRRRCQTTRSGGLKRSKAQRGVRLMSCAQRSRRPNGLPRPPPCRPLTSSSCNTATPSPPSTASWATLSTRCGTSARGQVSFARRTRRWPPRWRRWDEAGRPRRWRRSTRRSRCVPPSASTSSG